MAAGGYLAVRFVLASARGVYLADSFYLTMLTMSKVLLQYLTLLGSNSCIITSSVLGTEAFVYRGYRTEAMSQTLDPEILSIG